MSETVNWKGIMKMVNACDVIFNIIFTCKIYQDDEP